MKKRALYVVVTILQAVSFFVPAVILGAESGSALLVLLGLLVIPVVAVAFSARLYYKAKTHSMWSCLWIHFAIVFLLGFFSLFETGTRIGLDIGMSLYLLILLPLITCPHIVITCIIYRIIVSKKADF